MKPIIQRVLLKIADGNKRIADLSLASILELSRGDLTSNLFALGQGFSMSTANGRAMAGLVLQLILDDKSFTGSSPPWQYSLGRLLALDALLANDNLVFDEPGLFSAMELSYAHLNSGHSKVAKISRKVFIGVAKAAVAFDSEAFGHFWELTASLDPTLQMRLRKKLKPLAPVGVHPVGGVSRTPDSPMMGQQVNTIQPPKPLIRSTSHSPSRSNHNHSVSSTARPLKSTTKKPRPSPYKRSAPKGMQDSSYGTMDTGSYRHHQHQPALPVLQPMMHEMPLPLIPGLTCSLSQWNGFPHCNVSTTILVHVFHN